MFYKENYLSKETIHQFSHENSVEFALAFYEKVIADNSENYEFGLLNLKDENGNDQKYLLVQSTSGLRSKGFETFYGVGGGYGSLKGFVGLNYGKGFKDTPEYEYKKISANEVRETFVINENALNEAKDLLKDFHNLVSTETIKDKEGKEYILRIFENADTSIGGDLIVDKAVISDEKDNQIGYLLMKYTSPEIRKLLPLSKPSSHAVDNIFLNTAGVDYARIREDHQGRGLASAMYLKMAEHLNKKGIQFRASTLQSPEAKRLWKKLKTIYPDKVIFKNHPMDAKKRNDCLFFETEFLKTENTAEVKTKLKVKKKTP